MNENKPKQERQKYNPQFKNQALERAAKDGVARDVIDESARISPIVWMHILFAKRYHLQKSTGNN